LNLGKNKMRKKGHDSLKKTHIGRDLSVEKQKDRLSYTKCASLSKSTYLGSEKNGEEKGEAEKSDEII